MRQTETELDQMLLTFGKANLTEVRIAYKLADEEYTFDSIAYVTPVPIKAGGRKVDAILQRIVDAES